MKLLPTSIDIPQKNRDLLVALLNQQLANLSDLVSQTKQAHWNVRGSHFIAYHKLFEEIAGMFDQPIDQLAERVTALGGATLGTVRAAAENSELDELSPKIRADKELVLALRAGFKTAANLTRRAIAKAEQLDDAGTADLLTGISRTLDQSLWFLDATVDDRK